MDDGDQADSHLSINIHRLPTISASQALHNLDQSSGKWVTTGLSRLDLALKRSSVVTLPSQSNVSGGFPKGHITEIYGPPAAGKTAIGLQAAIEALRQGSHVVWIDANKPLYGPRLLSAFPEASSQDLLQKFHHYTAPTLPHLLALVCHSSPLFPPAGTTILIIDGLSALFTQTYPDNPNAALHSRKKTSSETWAASQRYTVITVLLSKLTKLAVIHNLAVVLISQTSIKVQYDIGAVLRPVTWMKSWTEGIANRVIVFRDFYRSANGDKRKGVRYVGVVKLNGVVRDRLDVLTMFQINSDGCRQIESEEILLLPAAVALPRVLPQKRKREEEEIADSQSDISDNELLLLIDQELEDDDVTAQVHVSFVRSKEEEHDLARFEAAMQDGFEDV
ncbi:MAG: hypothetical protein GOMPHAMPRED_006038 [Gomphillus americanus]|uniref:RecA family profile 1 domain-containing protein n=1 Tax=Gomphillus americanus TaxID=1940652 RepID=A0A8H3ELB5_9LECA|nr:MAG: hypothetical protein GOMPHAMPRED_006038 [Gomphillus americanus]